MKVKALRKIIFHTSKGEVIVKPGQVFKPSKPEELIKAGVAEPVILPPDQVGRPYWQRQGGSCYVCHSTEIWLSVHGVTVCARCHPPGHDRLVTKWGNA